MSVHWLDLTGYRHGDKVRASVLAYVHQERPGDIPSFRLDPIRPLPTSCVESFELVERAKPKVGDVIPGQDAQLLPCGSVISLVTDDGRGPLGRRVLTVRGWIGASSEEQRPTPSLPYLVEFLPPATA